MRPKPNPVTAKLPRAYELLKVLRDDLLAYGPHSYAGWNWQQRVKKINALLEDIDPRPEAEG